MRIEIIQELVEGVDSPLLIVRSPNYADARKPVALMLHGALGAAGALFPALPYFAQSFEPVLIDLPGHGRSPPPPAATLEAFVKEVVHLREHRFGDRRVVLVGESFGGLVALASARRCRAEAVLAVDPPLSTAKQWHVGAAFRYVMAERPGDAFVPAFGRNLFGIRADDPSIDERLYYPLLEDFDVPAVIVTGDVPLGAPRQTAATPCCIDAVDEYVIKRLTAGRVQVVRVADCGHVALRQNPAACHEALIRLGGWGA